MKLKHRITGTILMIAFATTSALPAATIPQLKSPPKPIAVMAPAAPKIPVVKVPSSPRIPTVKVPVVKVPSTPKIPSVPKVPAVKIPVTPKVPVVKVPSVPKLPSAPKVTKIPSAPKIPAVRIPTTPKTPVVKVPSAPKVPALVRTPQAPKVGPAIVKAPILVKSPNQPAVRAFGGKGAPKTPSQKITPAITSVSAMPAAAAIRQAVRDAKNNNPENVPDAGDPTNIPSLPDRRSNVGQRPSSGSTPGAGEKTATKDLFDVLRGKGGSAGAGPFSDRLPVRSTPTLQDVSQDGRAFDQGFGSSTPDLSVFDKDSVNPMSGINGSGGIGGLLGAAADQAGNGTPGGVAELGRGLISADGDNGKTPAKTPAEDTPPDLTTGAAANFTDAEGIKPRSGKTVEASPSLTEIVKNFFGIGSRRNGGEFLNSPDGDPAAAAAAPTKTPKPAPSAGQPDPESEGTVKVDIYSLSPGIAQQVGQSRSGVKGSQGGNGDMTPTQDGTSGPARDGTLVGNVGTQIKNNLVGNPGQNGGMREGGGTANAAPVRSNGSGVITPTNDQNMSSSGGRQEDPGDFFGNGVGPDQSRLNGSNSSTSSSDSSSNGNTSSKKEKKSE